MRKRLKLVLDTNILLVSISSRSPYHWLFQKLLQDEFDLVLTQDILLEYEEIISAHFNPSVAADIIRTLLALPNVHQVRIFYSWNLITTDPDDNKFVDCAVSANADFLISDDHHYAVLHQVPFPLVNVLTMNEFTTWLNASA